MTRSLSTSLVPEPGPEPRSSRQDAPLLGAPSGRTFASTFWGRGRRGVGGATGFSSDVGLKDTNPAPARGSRTRLRAKWTRGWFSAGRRTGERSRGQRLDAPGSRPGHLGVLPPQSQERGAPRKGPDVQLVRAARADRSPRTREVLLPVPVSLGLFPPHLSLTFSLSLCNSLCLSWSFFSLFSLPLPA